jgi:hypothetical protein
MPRHDRGTSGSKKSSLRVIESLPEENELARAFARISPRLASLQRSEVQESRLNVVRTASIVLAAHSRIVPLIAELEERTPCLAIECVHDLRDLALAAWDAHGRATAEARSRVPLHVLADEGRALRTRLYDRARALAVLGQLPAAPLRQVPLGRGYFDLAIALERLAELFGGCMSAVTSEELARAHEIALALPLAVTERALHDRSKAKDDALRAFTLLLRTYDEVRAAVRYVRWKERDADAIAPSLYKRKRTHKGTG